MTEFKQIIGRGTRVREAALADIPSIVEALLPDMLGAIDGPFALFGHSMGSMVAYATARALASQSAPVGMSPALDATNTWIPSAP